ncbi:MAG: hypothetical protein Q4G42_09255 [Neisseria sp.]|nr:hypothetical protein [Neisseria sp.]
MMLPHFFYRRMAVVLALLTLGACSAMGAISAYSAWQGYPIEDFIAQQGEPSKSAKQTFGKGYTYNWNGCWNTGRVVTYQQNIGGPYYSQAEQACTACTAYTDENNIITGIFGRCP